MIVLHLGPGEVESLAFGPDSRMLAVPWYGRLLVWEDPVVGGEPSVVGAEDGPIAGPVQLTGGRFQVRSHTAVRLYDPASGSSVAVPPGGGSPAHFIGFRVALTPDAASVVVCEQALAVSASGAVVSGIDRRPLSDPRPEAARWLVASEGAIYSDPLFFPNGRAFVTFERNWDPGGGWSELLLVARDLDTGQALWPSPRVASGFYYPVGSSDRRWIAGRHVHKLRVLDLNDPERPPVVISNEGKKHFTDLAFHPSGRYLAASGNDNTVKLYDTTTWKVAEAFAWKVGRLRSVAFSPDGCRAAVGSDRGQIVIWDVDL
jgi:WD40 repeat protein